MKGKVRGTVNTARETSFSKMIQKCLNLFFDLF